MKTSEQLSVYLEPLLAYDWRKDGKLIQDVNWKVNGLLKYKGEADQNKDNWQPPSVTMAIGTGDCEDYAILKQHLLAAVGINSFVQRFLVKKSHWDKHSGHAVLIVPVFFKRSLLSKRQRMFVVLENERREIMGIDDWADWYSEKGECLAYGAPMGIEEVKKMFS